MSRWPRLSLAAGCVLAATLAADHGLHARQAASAPDLKAAFLFNFAKFTTWPAGAVAPAAQLVACVAGDNRVADALEEQTRSQQVDGHSLVVQRIKAETTLGGCHVLYWSAANDARQDDLLHAAFKRPILTVSDSVEFAEHGGIAGFFVEAGKMRFDVNPAAADRAQLRISSKLLSLAKIVKDVPNAHTR